MSYLLDSNILIDFLNGRKETYSWVMEQRKLGSTLSVAFISRVEVLSMAELKDSQIKQIEDFLDTFRVDLFLSNSVLTTAAALRRKKLLTLGDAMVAATAIVGRMTLVTNDKRLAKGVKDLVPVLSI
ncbi:MAG: type II toxin-antitoxin system VapC family toxin [Minisyncoccia bacterium]